MDLSRIISKKLTIFINYKPQTNGKIPFRIDTANHTFDASLLDGTEHSEIHFRKALIKKEAIPTPEVAEIDEEVYDKLYPVIKQDKPAKLIRTIPDDGNKIPDYDMDLADQLWLEEKQPTISKLTPELFERAIEYLEMNCDRRVPSLEDLESQPFRKSHNKEVLADIFDYWLEKRLKERTKLYYKVKTKDQRLRRTHKIVVDPYVAFRHCQEIRHTRRNRAAEHRNYIKMLQLRRGLAPDVKFLRSKALEAEVSHALLKFKCSLFEVQYRIGNFDSQLASGTFAIQSNLKDLPVENGHSSDSEEQIVEVDDERKFQFKPREGSKYFLPFDSFCELSQEPEPTNFFDSTSGFIRQRMGRGGRIVFDRRISERRNSTPDYKQINIKPRVLCENIWLQPPSTSQSTFSLKNSSSDLSQDGLSPESFLLELIPTDSEDQ